MASYVFRLKDPESTSQNVEDWKGCDKIDSNDLSGIKDPMNDGSNKVATSVPSPFARMHLFNTAFDILANDNSTSMMPLEGSTVYHQIVSDCFDMFQLIFMYGQDKNLLRFENWDCQTRLDELENSNSPGHKRLALALRSFLNKDSAGSLRGLNQITFVYYKDILVGGTSPLTMFFTGANWHRSLKEEKLTIKTPTEDILFDAEYAPLFKRDESFILYILSLFECYQDEFRQSSLSFYRYMNRILDHPEIRAFKRRHGDTLGQISDRKGFENKYTTNFVDGRYPLTVGNLIIPCQGEEEIESDFSIEPSRTAKYPFTERSAGGDSIEIRKPLVLPQDGKMHQNWFYTKSTWNKDIATPENVTMPLYKRQLPELNITYPYLTVGDFLTETLIQTPYSAGRVATVNTDKFVYGSNAKNIHFLLPLKPRYFQYFTADDLQEHLHVESENTEDDLIVTVSLDIPTKRGSVKYSRTFISAKYSPSSNPSNGSAVYRIINHEKTGKFGMGFYPFFQLANTNIPFHYYIQLVEDKHENVGFDLQFYSSLNQSSDSPVGKLNPEHIASTLRSSRKDEAVANSTFYEVQKQFDFLELELTDAKTGERHSGLIVPKFRVIDAMSSSSEFIAAVDFGTSNTHVAISKVEGGSVNPTPLSFSEPKGDVNSATSDERLMISLYMSGSQSDNLSKKYYTDSMIGFNQMSQFVLREFIPPVIEKTKDEEALIPRFPLKTASCERRGFDDNDNNVLFGNFNIGFSVDADKSPVNNSYSYNTNLKWLFDTREQQPKNEKRIELFFVELLEIIRNKVLLSGGSLQKLKIVWMLPDAAADVRKTFADRWKKASEIVFGSDLSAQIVPATPISESLAPFYYIDWEENLAGANAAAVNLDIGGGTTDIIYIERQEGVKYWTMSYRFAGNDIWGDGRQELKAPKKVNGFYQVYKAWYDANNDRLENAKSFKEYFSSAISDSRRGSHDVISLLFKYQQSGFERYVINSHPDLRLIPLIHYGGLLYHLLQSLQLKNVQKLPRYLSFSGNGSQYLNLLGDSTGIEYLTNILVNAFIKDERSGLRFPESKLEVIKVGNVKEATANGGIILQHGKVKNTVEKGNEDLFSLGANPNYPIGEMGTKKFGELDENTKIAIIENCKNFLSILFENPEVTSFMIKELQVEKEREIKDFLMNEHVLEDSFNSYFKDGVDIGNRLATQTLFFLPLKDALVRLSTFLANASKS